MVIMISISMVRNHDMYLTLRLQATSDERRMPAGRGSSLVSSLLVVSSGPAWEKISENAPVRYCKYDK